MSFDQLMIHYCAPTICNIKPGNIFFVKNEVFCENTFRQWENLFLTHGLLSFAIRLSETSTAVLVCNKSWVEGILNSPAVQSYLIEKKCFSSTLLDFVHNFSRKIESEKSFPHEIGIILGYPIDDVIEYEKNEGRNCKYSGCWKSYSNVEYTKSCQCRYKNCSRMCEKLFENGYTVPQIIDAYNAA